MNLLISVVIPTHNPNQTRLRRTLGGLQNQTISNNNWELIIVDNASLDPQYLPSLDLSWHKSSKIVVEHQLGLTRARLTGIQASQGKYIVFVDDDNVLDPDYLENTINIFSKCPDLGVIGGKSLPEFEVKPESWVQEFGNCLALRDFGEEPKIYFHNYLSNTDKHHPFFAPIGAGMCLQRKAAKLYADSLVDNPSRLLLDRTGKNLQSGGDCDINLILLEVGWGVGYFPQLQLTHLISANRLTRDYLAKVNYASSRSWIQVLGHHNICPWEKIPSWSILFRQLKAFFTYKAWKDNSAYVRWKGACGLFAGLASLDF